MKKNVAFLMCFTLMFLSACSSTGEGQVIDLTNKSSDVSSYVNDKSNDDGIRADWVDKEDVDAFLSKNLPLDSANGQIAMNQLNKAQDNIDDWYLSRYCAPLITITYNFSEKEINQSRLLNFAWRMQRYYMDVSNLTETENTIVAFPSAVVDEMAAVFFGVKNLKHPIAGYDYDAEKSVYLISAGMDFGAPTDMVIEQVDVNDDNSISIYYGLIDLNVSDEELNGNPEPSLYYCVTVKDNDDGQTWRYIEGKEYFPGEESETTPAPDNTSESDSTEVPEETTSSES